ncbi:hypothetical protein BC962_2202 [Gillisia mitskevichiae]|uniref:Uncharacterized protein n=1 Tax=Gillisia mitskevichiae TaxID=270921 RepID=A0A495PVY1_9FLAO|nr:hypothetical protein [Gillisia mitskevichiae]RKS53935.1 hypothetical protein BC962_2202 [Gillisia mitskevichiae]
MFLFLLWCKNDASQILIDVLKSILNRDVIQSIKNLEEYQEAFPLYSLNLVLEKLKQNKESLLDRNNPEWKLVFNLILDNYSSKLPASVIEKLKNQ